MNCAKPILITLAFATGLLVAPARAGEVTVKVGTIDQVNQLIQNAVLSGERTVVIPKGHYMASGGTQTTVLVNESLVIEGKGVVIDSEYKGDCITVTADNVTIRGLTLLNGVNGIEAWVASGSVDGLHVLQNRIANCSETGIDIRGNSAVIQGNRVTGCDIAGIVYDAPASTSTTIIRKNVITKCGGGPSDDDYYYYYGDEDIGGILASDGQLLIEQNRSFQNTGVGISVLLVLDNNGLPPKPSLVSRNRCSNNSSYGVAISVDGIDAFVQVDRNVCRENDDGGVFAEGIGSIGAFPSGTGFLIYRNRCHTNGGHGIVLSADSALGAPQPCMLTRNSSRKNIGAGIKVYSYYDYDYEPPADPGNHILSSNVARANGRDGINIVGARNSILKNRCDRNLGDGIDVDLKDLFDNQPARNDNVLEGNRCARNGHEGIDNSGTNTLLIANRTGKNGNGLGPDIATSGDGGTGTVDVKSELNLPALNLGPNEDVRAVHDKD